MATLRGFLAGLLAAEVGAMPWLGPSSTYLVGTNDEVDEPKTTAAALANDFHRRDPYPVSLCGWIAGVESLGAWCSSQSSCVWNTDNSFVGCCDTSSNSCAFYTSCVDYHSTGLTADRDDIYTCRGTLECYRNTYPSGYLQYGCGRSNWATTVLTSINVSHRTSSLEVVFTGTPVEANPTATPEYTTVTLTAEPSNFYTTASSTSTQISATNGSPGGTASARTSSIAGAEASTGTPTPTAVARAAPKGPSTGAIAGGTVGGIFGAAILASIILFLWRRIKRDRSQGEKGSGEAFTAAEPPVAELESPKHSPAPFQDISAVSSPINGRYSTASVTVAGGSSKPVELP
ncbi:hypothetical protein PWT90_01699 [Aphanocladium album]|nr:hypothetical protein PWT90_01699 [Aphanocladium album]